MEQRQSVTLIVFKIFISLEKGSKIDFNKFIHALLSARRMLLQSNCRSCMSQSQAGQTTTSDVTLSSSFPIPMSFPEPEDLILLKVQFQTLQLTAEEGPEIGPFERSNFGPFIPGVNY